MAKSLEETDGQQETAEQARRELRQLPEGTKLTWEDAMSYVRRLGIKMPPGWTSADDIRQLRGPLPADDPDFVNVTRRR
jgi:hypothetical protein